MRLLRDPARRGRRVSTQPRTEDEEHRRTRRPVARRPGGGRRGYAQDAIDGKWEGAIELGGQRLGFAVTFQSDPALAAFIDIQGAAGLEREKVSWSPPSVRFELTGGAGDLRALRRAASVEVGRRASGISFWRMEPAG